MRSIATRLLILLSVLAVAPHLQAQTPPPTRFLVRIDNVTRDRLVQTRVITQDDYRPASLISLVRDTALVILTRAERDTVLKQGLTCTTILEAADDLTLIRRAMYGPTMELEPPYHTYATLNREIDSLQRAFPGLIRVFTIGETTAGKTPIRAVKLSRNVGKDDDRPTLLFDGCHHSNEILGAEICLAILRTFTRDDGKDPEITGWLNRFQIYVVPVLNVDGYQVVTSGADPRWRKNRRDTDGNGVLEITDGVDINRNYDFNWAHGGSSDPQSGRYRGAYPFSESENQALASLARAKRFLASITYHSQGEVIYYPWTWGGRKAPDDSLLTSIARDIAGSIRTLKKDTTYGAEYGAGLVGQSYPWLYGALGTFDFVIETGRGASFPPASLVNGIVEENLKGVRTFLRRAEGPGIRLRVTDSSSGTPLEAEVWVPGIETEDVHRRVTRRESGIFYRLLLPGFYTVIVSAPGYEPLVLREVLVDESGWTAIAATLGKRNSK
jgi:hypothetical protein